MCVKDFNYDKSFTQIKKHTLDKLSKPPAPLTFLWGFFLLFLILLFGIDDFGSASKG